MSSVRTKSDAYAEFLESLVHRLRAGECLSCIVLEVECYNDAPNGQPEYEFKVSTSEHTCWPNGDA